MRLPTIKSKDPAIKYRWVTSHWYRKECRRWWAFDCPELVHTPDNRIWTFPVPELDGAFVVLIMEYVK